MRDYQCKLNAVRVQNLVTSTAKACRKFAKRHGISNTTIQLPDDTIAYWLGPQKATKVVVFFHGGAYMSPALSEHISCAFGFSKTPGEEQSAVILQYDLASENANHYPRQLQQSVSLLNHLIHTEKIPPSAMTFIGDSAGAHIILGLLLHLNHPNPQVEPLKLDEPFSGAALISPWVNMASTSASMEANEHKDIVTNDSLEYWARNFFGDAPIDPWNSPLTAPVEWWTGLPVGDILITYGDNEMFRDDATRLCETLQASHAGTTTSLKAMGELHTHMLMNRFLRVNKPCESERVFMEWMKNHMKN